MWSSAGRNLKEVVLQVRARERSSLKCPKKSSRDHGRDDYIVGRNRGVSKHRPRFLFSSKIDFPAQTRSRPIKLMAGEQKRNKSSYECSNA